MSNTDELYGQLKESFPDKAYSADSSRGFQLTSLKAAYVTERLNDVFGLCGIGWRYAYSPIRSETIGGKDEQVVHVALQFRVEDKGNSPIYWDHSEQRWSFQGSTCWSEPIFAVGGNSVGKGSIPVTDAMKSAVTNGIGKAASMIGVGHEVFRGEIRVGRQPQQSSSPAEGARERAKAPAAPSDDGKQPSRTKPLTPAQVESAIRTKAAGVKDGGNNATGKQVGAIASLFQKAFPDEEDPAGSYHACLEWLCRVSSAKGLTFGQATSLLDWLKESDDSWELHPCVIDEANAILEKVRE